MVFQILQYYINQQVIEDLVVLLLNVGNLMIFQQKIKIVFYFLQIKKKIYFSKNNDLKVSNFLVFGPSFSKGGFCIITIGSAALECKYLKTNEQRHKDIFGGDENALSEDGNYKGVYAKEYEVFQIIFE